MICKRNSLVHQNMSMLVGKVSHHASYRLVVIHRNCCCTNMFQSLWTWHELLHVDCVKVCSLKYRYAQRIHYFMSHLLKPIAAGMSLYYEPKYYALLLLVLIFLWSQLKYRTYLKVELITVMMFFRNILIILSHSLHQTWSY